jgi:hypothetical protein
MHYLYLDESGDLGHYIQSPGSSRHFVITVMEVVGSKDNKAIEKAVARTLNNKLQWRLPNKSRYITELKATDIDFPVKSYFFRQAENVPFKLYTVIFDKTRYPSLLQEKKSRVYDFIAHLAMKELPLEQSTTRIVLTLDKSKSKPEIREFNQYMLKQVQSKVPPHVPFIIHHNYSHENKPLQAVDLFSWGIFRKYEKGDKKWYDVFKTKIAYEKVYPPS